MPHLERFVSLTPPISRAANPLLQCSPANPQSHPNGPHGSQPSFGFSLLTPSINSRFDHYTAFRSLTCRRALIIQVFLERRDFTLINGLMTAILNMGLFLALGVIAITLACITLWASLPEKVPKFLKSTHHKKQPRFKKETKVRRAC